MALRKLVKLSVSTSEKGHILLGGLNAVIQGKSIKQNIPDSKHSRNVSHCSQHCSVLFYTQGPSYTRICIHPGELSRVDQTPEGTYHPPLGGHNSRKVTNLGGKEY